MSNRARVDRIAGKFPPARYFRLWNPETCTDSRSLICFKWEPPKYQEQITEAEYMQATGATLSNSDIEGMQYELINT